jgi:hypothetical protein
MNKRLLEVAVWSALKHLFLLAPGALRSSLAILGEARFDEGGIRKFWLGSQPYLFWQLAFLICHLR